MADGGQEAVGSVRFRVISTMGDDTQVTITPTASIGGPWISGEDFITELQPNYNQVNITFDQDELLYQGFESF